MLPISKVGFSLSYSCIAHTAFTAAIMPSILPLLLPLCGRMLLLLSRKICVLSKFHATTGLPSWNSFLPTVNCSKYFEGSDRLLRLCWHFLTGMLFRVYSSAAKLSAVQGSNARPCKVYCPAARRISPRMVSKSCTLPGVALIQPSLFQAK